MFERIKNALASGKTPRAAQEEINRWAQQQGLSFQVKDVGGYKLGGHWQGHAFRADCSPSSRSYIQGFELKARAELSLSHEVGLVVMNRALKRTFEAYANALYDDFTDPLKTRSQQVPEEVRWLSMFRDAGWAGPEEDFWAKFAVLTDAADIARKGFDEKLVEQLMHWPDSVKEGTPMLFMLDRGSTYLRLQLRSPKDAAAALHALDTFMHFSAGLARLLAR